MKLQVFSSTENPPMADLDVEETYIVWYDDPLGCQSTCILIRLCQMEKVYMLPTDFQSAKSLLD